MSEKRFTTEIVDWWKTANQTKIVKENGKWIDADDCASLLNALYEENEFLTWNYKELVQFVKSKGYKLGDFLDYLGQFQSIGVEKEEWGEELVDKIKELKYALQQRTKQCDEYYKENKQLREEIKDFQDILARKEEEILKPVIRVIDEKIEKANEGIYQTYDSWYFGQKEVLIDLKKELMEY